MMRLIQTTKLQLEAFSGDVPPYAILSHTWAEEEVDLHCFNGIGGRRREDMKGFGKIEKSCELARQHGLDYVWVDTCCIDKTSSAELSEAINSMYRWYNQSVVCFAWLCDWDQGGTLQKGSATLAHCRWFRRGWTLQELIAPQRVEFYNRNWTFCGTKDSFQTQMSEITGISPAVLADSDQLEFVCVAQRMSWMATRETTRQEDKAYCLIGIFGINMPLLYGEGDKAFLRLQDEIIKYTNDMSIFAWKSVSSSQTHDGVLATSPSHFAWSRHLLTLNKHTFFNPEVITSNKGIRFEAPLYVDHSGSLLLALNCWDAETPRVGDEELAIMLRNHGGNVFTRIHSTECSVADPNQTSRSTNITDRMYICRTVSRALSRELEDSSGQAIVLRKGCNSEYRMIDASFPFSFTLMQHFHQYFEPDQYLFFTKNVSRFISNLYFHENTDPHKGRPYQGFKPFMVVFGKRLEDEEPWITILTTENKIMERALHRGEERQLEEAARMQRTRSADFTSSVSQRTYTIRVGLEKGTRNGSEVYFVDVVMTEYKKDTKGVRRIVKSCSDLQQPAQKMVVKDAETIWSQPAEKPPIQDENNTLPTASTPIQDVIATPTQPPRGMIIKGIKKTPKQPLLTTEPVQKTSPQLPRGMVIKGVKKASPQPLHGKHVGGDKRSF